MNMLKLFTALCLMALTSAISLAAAETVDLGQVKLSMDLQGIGPYKVEKENPSSLTNTYGGNTFTYQLFPATIATGNASNRVLLEVHQASAPLSLSVPISKLNGTIGLEHLVEISDMIPSGKDSKDIQKQTYYVDGYKGIAFIINMSQKGPIYLAAYSPDIKDGFGKTVVIIGSDFPLNTTKHIFESVKTQLVQNNAVSQSNNAGQSSLGQGNSGQSNSGQGNSGQNNMGTMSQSNMGQSNTGMSNMGQSNTGMSNMGQNSMGTSMMNMMNMGMNMMQSMMGMGQGGMGMMM